MTPNPRNRLINAVAAASAALTINCAQDARIPASRFASAVVASLNKETGSGHVVTNVYRKGREYVAIVSPPRRKIGHYTPGGTELDLTLAGKVDSTELMKHVTRLLASGEHPLITRAIVGPAQASEVSYPSKIWPPTVTVTRAEERGIRVTVRRPTARSSLSPRRR